LTNLVPDISSPEEITSLRVFIVLLETFSDMYKSLSPITSLDSGNACISMTLLETDVSVIVIVSILISPLS